MPRATIYLPQDLADQISVLHRHEGRRVNLSAFACDAMRESLRRIDAGDSATPPKASDQAAALRTIRRLASKALREP